MSEPGQSSNVTPMEISSGPTGTPSSVVLIRPSATTPTTVMSQQIRPAMVGGRVINVASSGSSPAVGRTGVLSPSSGAGGNVGAGGFVLRGNQLVRLPVRAAESPMATGAKSPLKVHLVSATGMIKQQPLGPQMGPGAGVRPQGKPGGTPGASQDQTGDKSKTQQYQVLMPSAQNSQQVVVVNAAGATKQSRVIPAKPSGPGVKGESVVYLGGGSVGASATIGEGSLQSMSMTGAPAFKKSRPIGIPGNRKPCNCTKSQCLKLYCECFANGEFCRNCNCNNCHNNLAYENERSKSIKMCLERNPYAFQPKIGKGRADTERLHNKGCNCKKSSCLKNYCECYEAKVPCTHRCKCVGCRNTEGDRIHKYRGAGGLQSLANAASLISGANQTGDYSARADSPDSEASYDKPDPKRMPWFYMTDDVVEATAFCLLAKAEEMESKGTYDDVECQREILKEFGRSLQQIISSACD